MFFYLKNNIYIMKERILTNGIKIFLVLFIVLMFVICAFTEQNNEYNMSKHIILKEYRDSVKQKNKYLNEERSCETCVIK